MMSMLTDFQELFDPHCFPILVHLLTVACLLRSAADRAEYILDGGGGGGALAVLSSVPSSCV